MRTYAIEHLASHRGRFCVRVVFADGPALHGTSRVSAADAVEGVLRACERWGSPEAYSRHIGAS